MKEIRFLVNFQDIKHNYLQRHGGVDAYILPIRQKNAKQLLKTQRKEKINLLTNNQKNIRPMDKTNVQ